MTKEAPSSPNTYINPTDFTIEQATVYNLGEVADFLVEAYADTYPNDRGIERNMFEGNVQFRAQLEENLDLRLRDPATVLLVAREDEAILGTIGLRVSGENRSEGELWGFYVGLNHQSRGVGRKLWDQLYSSESAMALSEVKLRVAKDSKKPRTFYEKNSFIVVGEEDWDWPDWADTHPHNLYLAMRRQLH